MSAGKLLPVCLCPRGASALKSCNFLSQLEIHHWRRDCIHGKVCAQTQTRSNAEPHTRTADLRGTVCSFSLYHYPHTSFAVMTRHLLSLFLTQPSTRSNPENYKRADVAGFSMKNLCRLYSDWTENPGERLMPRATVHPEPEQNSQWGFQKW